MRDLLLFLVKSLVSSPDRVELQEHSGERGLVFEIKVDHADRGRIIGKEGRTIKAIRTLASAAPLAAGQRLAVDLFD